MQEGPAWFKVWSKLASAASSERLAPLSAGMRKGKHGCSKASSTATKNIIGTPVPAIAACSAQHTARDPLDRDLSLPPVPNRYYIYPRVDVALRRCGHDQCQCTLWVTPATAARGSAVLPAMLNTRKARTNSVLLLRNPCLVHCSAGLPASTPLACLATNLLRTHCKSATDPPVQQVVRGPDGGRVLLFLSVPCPGVSPLSCNITLLDMGA